MRFGTADASSDGDCAILRATPGRAAPRSCFQRGACRRFRSASGCVAVIRVGWVTRAPRARGDLRDARWPLRCSASIWSVAAPPPGHGGKREPLRLRLQAGAGFLFASVAVVARDCQTRSSTNLRVACGEAGSVAAAREAEQRRGSTFDKSNLPLPWGRKIAAAERAETDVRRSIARIKASPSLPRRTPLPASSTTSRRDGCGRSPERSDRRRRITRYERGVH